jgi:hypothetical protein
MGAIVDFDQKTIRHPYKNDQFCVVIAYKNNHFIRERPMKRFIDKATKMEWLQYFF